MNRSDSKPVPVFLLALWFGLLAGLVEGFTYLLFEYTGLLSWVTELHAVNENILWVSPAMDLLVFLALACLLKPLIRPLGRHALGVVVTVFSTLGFYAFFAVSGRLREISALALAAGLGTVVKRWVKRDPGLRLQFMKKTFGPLVATGVLVCVGAICWGPALEKIEMARLPAPPPNAPNILLIVLDTLRADRLGCYGYALPTTPFLDQYSRESVLFEKAFANAPWTLPSHVSFFTGYLPSAHGAVSTRYDGRFPTIAQEMARYGYATAGIMANDSFGSRAHGFARGFIHWENGFTDALDSAERTALGRRIKRYFYHWFHVSGFVDHILSPEVNRRCLRWLDSRSDRPFFLFLNYMDVHGPLLPPRKFAERFSTQPDRISPRLQITRNDNSKAVEGFDFPRMNEAYNASLASLDEQLGKLFAELRQRKLENNTLVIIVSDHGESLGDHGIDGHATSLYREQIQVPLLVRFPGVTPPGRRIADVAGLQNLPATIAELTGLPRSPFPGVSLSRWWHGSPPEDRRVVSEVDRPDVTFVPRNLPISQGWLKSVTDDSWHFILQQHGNRELFNLDADVREEKNLAGPPESQARMAEMQNHLERLLGFRLPRAAEAKPGATR